MKLLVLGAAGMLGHRLYRVLANRFEIWGTLRGDPEKYQQYQLLPLECLIGKADAQHFDSVRMAIEKSQPKPSSTALESSNNVMRRNRPSNRFTSIPSSLTNWLNYASKATSA